MKNKKIVYGVTSLIFIIDQIIKIIVNHSMQINTKLEIIPHFFRLFYVKNTGAAFSILENSTLLLIVISTIVILVSNRYIIKSKDMNNRESIYIGLLMGGILGNLLDRIIHAGVIDYLSFTFFSYDFAIFNFADAAITIGVALYVLDTFLTKEKKK